MFLTSVPYGKRNKNLLCAFYIYFNKTVFFISEKTGVLPLPNTSIL